MERSILDDLIILNAQFVNTNRFGKCLNTHFCIEIYLWIYIIMD